MLLEAQWCSRLATTTPVIHLVPLGTCSCSMVESSHLSVRLSHLASFALSQVYHLLFYFIILARKLCECGATTLPHHGRSNPDGKRTPDEQRNPLLGPPRNIWSNHPSNKLSVVGTAFVPAVLFLLVGWLDHVFYSDTPALWWCEDCICSFLLSLAPQPGLSNDQWSKHLSNRPSVVGTPVGCWLDRSCIVLYPPRWLSFTQSSTEEGFVFSL